MRIVCNQCEAEYNLDDDKLTDEGLLVRCPKCQNTFRVKGHDTSVADAPMDVPAEGSEPDEPFPPAARVNAGPSPFFDEEAPLPETSPDPPEPEGPTVEAAVSYDLPDKLVTGEMKETPETPPEEEEETSEPPHVEAEHFFESYSSDMEYDYRGRGMAWKILPAFLIGAIVAVFLIPQLRKPLTAGITDVSWRVQEYLLPPSPLVIEGIESRFIRNHRGSVLFVAEGHVRNRSKASIQCPMIIARLYDTSGAEIHKSIAACGRVLRMEELRTFGRARVREMFEPSEGGKSISAVQPGHSIPFMVVFYDIPEGAAEFEIEVQENPAPGIVNEEGVAFNPHHPPLT